VATLKNTTINDTGFLGLPSGTTAQRPASPIVGTLRYNTTTNYIEAYFSQGWTNVAQGVADGSTAERAAVSAAAIKSATGTTTSGYYYIILGGTARQVYCDMSGSTAWMLAMRASGSAATTTFGWSSAYWTNSTGLNETSDPLTDVDIKNSYIWTNWTVNSIRLTGSQTASAYTANPTATFTGWSQTLQTIFSQGNNSYSGNIEWGRTNWINWANSACGTSTSFWDNQPNCNVDAVNAYGTYHGSRFGITFNNENDCGTNDSGVGFGQFRNGLSDLSCGAIKWNTDARYPCHGWFWVA